MNKISILDIIYDTTVDGPGFRTTLYAAGCLHQCPGCHNPQSWDVKNGRLYTVDAIFDIIIQNEFSNVTFSGGDPLLQVTGFTALAKLIKAKTNKSIWCYTGYKFEQVLKSRKLSQILPFIDVMVDGKYISDMKNENIRFRGSSNQRIIDVKESLKHNKPITGQIADAVDAFAINPNGFGIFSDLRL